MSSHYSGYEVGPSMVEYRNKFCRICLEHFQGGLIPIEADVKQTTLQEMFIQLTTLELENDDAFPTSMCEQCVSKLALAYSIRQEFIYQTEYLLKLVVDRKIMTYYQKYSVDPPNLQSTIPNATKESPKTRGANHSYSRPNEPGNRDSSLQMTAEDVKIEGIKVEKIKVEEEESVSDQEAKSARDETMAEVSADGQDPENDTIFYDIKSEDSVSTASDDSWGFTLNSYHPSNAQNSETVPKKTRRPAVKRQKPNPNEAKERDPNAVVKNQYSTTICFICDKKHETIEQRDDHFRHHIHMVPYECNECVTDTVQDDPNSSESGKPLVLKSVIQLNSHLMMHQMPHKCPFCYRRFTTTLLLNHHLWNYHEHSKEGLTCEWCGKRYFQRRPFQEHVRRHKNAANERFKCPTCNRTFGSNALLRRHLPVHTGEKNFKCTYCGRLFNRRCNLLDHLRLHTGERCHKCADCDEAFNNNVSLMRHRQQQHMAPSENDNPRRVDRNIYVLQEDGSKLYRCKHEGCEFTSTASTIMTQHRSRHNNNPYACDECGQRFLTPKSVLKHKAYMHSGRQKKRMARVTNSTDDTNAARKQRKRIQRVDTLPGEITNSIIRSEFADDELNVVREYVVEFVEDSNAFEA